MGGELAGSQARGLGSGAGVLVGQLFFSWCMMIISMHAMRSPGLVLLQQQQQPGGSHWVATGGHDRPGRARKGEAEPNRERKRERGEQLRAVVAPVSGSYRPTSSRLQGRSRWLRSPDKFSPLSRSSPCHTLRPAVGSLAPALTTAGGQHGPLPS